MNRIIQRILLCNLPLIFFQASAYGAVFFDDFSIDTTTEYAVTDTWTTGGVGAFLYDAIGERVQVLTGDDIGLQFSHDLPASSSGTFSIDVLPTINYPVSGWVIIRLVQDQTNYYEVRNTDGNGPGEIKKVVNGLVVDSASFQNEYVQNNNYHITIDFSPGNTVVDAYGEVLVLSTDNSSIPVSSFEVKTGQQDAYYDNIVYSNDTTPPVWDTSVGIVTATDEGIGGSVQVEFGTATDAVDGTNVQYNIYYAETSSWSADWSLNSVVSTTGSPYTVAGLSDGVEYTFGVRVADQSGNEDDNTATLTAIPSGGVVDTTPPVWDTSVGIVAATDEGIGGSVQVEFGTATDAVDGTNVQYNIYYAETSSWSADWSLNSVVSTTGSPYTVAGLSDGVEYTFGVRVADQSGNEDDNTATLTAIPSGASVFFDDFSIDSTTEYAVTDTWTTGGVGAFLYDAIGERVQVLTGDNIGLQFSHDLPVSASGTFSIDVLPTINYPVSGWVIIRLVQDQTNYYEVRNTDGNGPGEIKKVVNGQVVESVFFQNEYAQNNNYHITIDFSPGNTVVDAYGEVLVLSTDNSSIMVSSFKVKTGQQDAYYDNIVYSNDTTPPVWDTSVGIVTATDEGIGGSVQVEFGTATDAVDGTNVQYNIYYAETSSWSADWSLNSVVSTTGSPYTVTGLSDGVEYTFGVRVADQSGNEDDNTATLTAIPSGGGSVFFDDFSIDSTPEYAVTDTWTAGGVGAFLYDAIGERVQVLTGDNIGLQFSHDLPVSASGTFSIDVLPTINYPVSGWVIIRLVQDQTNYYEVRNTDGNGPGEIKKVVNGLVVDSASFQNEYVQNNNYHITIDFSPGNTVVDAYGEVLVLSTDNSSIPVSSFEVKTGQQDAYYDNIVYSNDTTPPVWDTSVGIVTATDEGIGGSVQVEFGTATDAVDGTNVQYNIYYAETSSWSADWSLNSVVSTTGSPYTVAGLSDGVEYTFGVRVADQSGNEDDNTATLTAIPSGGVVDTTPPVWDTSVGIVAATDEGIGGSVQVEFGTATDAVDGTNVQYNIYYAETSSWSADWSLNSVVSTTGSPYTVAGLSDGVEYTFGVRVADQSGNEDDNTATLTAIPSGASVFFDDFSIDSTTEYAVTDTWTTGGVGAFLYDAIGERVQVLTGDNIGLQFSHDLPVSASGTFSIDVLPTINYPVSGWVIIRLVQDQTNYYEVRNTDGNGPGEIKKVVNGQVVESVFFQNEYAQNNNYHITIDFSPGNTVVDAYGEVLVLSTDNSSIMVSSFKVKTGQQDAYYDNIFYSSGEPFVKIVEPKNYYLQEQADIMVYAIASQLPADWGIKFILDSSVTVLDSIPPFEVLFTSLVTGEHVIDAFVIDDLGLEVIGAYTHDAIINIGVGDYYVALGDSITNGLDDDVPIDDISSDGRNIGGGYEPILNDLLTSFHEYPHNIANEGVPGDASIDGLFNISTVLSRHQNSSRFLVQYGTNDANIFLPFPSGLGLNFGDPGYPGSFKDNMQQIIAAIDEAGKEVSLAKIPIALAGCMNCDPYIDPAQGQKNIIIQEYNEVIDELVADPLNSIVVIPPDFYAYFSYFDPNTNRFRYEDEYATYLHPNGIGYQSMADLWFQALTQ